MKTGKRIRAYGWAVVIGLAAILGGTPPLRAEPYIAIREGLKCSVCHANMTGGSLRTDRGVTFSQQDLPMVYFAPWNDLPTPSSSGSQAEATGGKDSPSTKEQVDRLISGKITSFLWWGTDFRFRNVTRVTHYASETNQFEVNEGNLYLRGALIPDYLYFQLDQEVAPEAASAREAFGLLRNLPFDAYIKAGKFFVPYGLRLQDNSAYIRTFPHVTMDEPDIGVELGLEPGPFSFSLAVTNGTGSNSDDNTGKRLSFVGSFVDENFRIGGETTFNPGYADDYDFASGGFLGATYGRFTLLGEADFLRTRVGALLTHSYVVLGELDVLALDGLNLKATYEYYNPDLQIAKDERTRWSFIAEPFVTQFAQVRAGARINDGPRGSPALRAKEFFAELHFFL